MPNTIKVVLDLNLFVSALIGRPATRALLDQWREQRFVLILSQELLTELLAVLARPKFNKYFSEEDVRILTELIQERAVFVQPTVRLALCRDPKDNILLEVAATAKAEFLVTGDKDLVDDPALVRTMLDDYQVQIVTISKLLEYLLENN